MLWKCLTIELYPKSSHTAACGTEVEKQAHFGLLYKDANTIQEGKTLMTSLFFSQTPFLNTIEMIMNFHLLKWSHTNMLALVQEVAGHSSVDEDIQ